MKTIFNLPLIGSVLCAAILCSGCGDEQIVSVQDLKLNEDVNERFQPRERPDRALFQYGQGAEIALDIVVPIDPSGIKQINRAHNYYVSSGSRVEFNIETLVKLSTYEIDEDLEERGELVVPSQWMSACTFRHPVTGSTIKNKDGDDAEIDKDPEKAFELYTAYLRQCTGLQTSHPYLTEGYSLGQPCESFQFGSANDPFSGQNVKKTDLYTLCMLGGRLAINESSSFSQIVDVHSYNDTTIAYEDLRFVNDIKPAFMAVDNAITNYRVHMTPDPDNASVAAGTAANENFLRYEWQMPADADGVWDANFASDIDIAYVRFYWTDTQNNLLPIINDPRLGMPSHEIQANFGNVCKNLDGQGYFRANGCNLFNIFTPAASKADLSSKVTWRMKILYDSHNYEMIGHWGRPLVMEFGIKAD